MTVEDRLRRSLRRKGEQAQPSPEAWDRITHRIEGAARAPSWLVPALALGTAAALVAVTVTVIGQGDDASDVKLAEPASTTSEPTAARRGVDDKSQSFAGIWPETTWDEYEAEMAAVAEGQRPWRLDPVEVATAYIREKGLGSPELAEYEEFPEDRTCGHVRYTLPGGDAAEGNFVEVCRFDEDPPILVVTAAWSDRLVYREPLYESALELSVEIAAPGTLEVRAGAFKSEWIDERSIEVTPEEIAGAGHKAVTTLDLGSEPALPPSILVQIVHRPPGSAPAAFTEFRLDLADDSPQARFPEISRVVPAGARQRWTIPRK